MEFKCFFNWNQLPDSAEPIFASAAQNSMFFSRAWFETLSANALQDDENILFACVIEGDNVLAILPLKQGRNNDWYALGHLYSWLYTPLLKEQASDAVLKCLTQGIEKSPCQSLRLEPVAQDDKNILRLKTELETVGFYCNFQYRFYNWFHPVMEKTIDEYMSSRPSRVKNTIARKQRKLAREHDFCFRLFSDEDVAIGIADYKKVYESSWKAKELFDGLLESLVMSFASQGWLRLGLLYINEEPAAAQLWFVVHGKANIFKLAYDENWKQYSPGSILFRQMMECVIEKDGVEEIDFLMGNDAYKQDWMTERRERWGLYCGRQHKAEKRVSGILDFLNGIFHRIR
jgi:hypothetical protein